MDIYQNIYVCQGYFHFLFMVEWSIDARLYIPISDLIDNLYLHLNNQL